MIVLALIRYVSFSMHLNPTQNDSIQFIFTDRCRCFHNPIENRCFFLPSFSRSVRRCKCFVSVCFDMCVCACVRTCLNVHYNVFVCMSFTFIIVRENNKFYNIIRRLPLTQYSTCVFRPLLLLLFICGGFVCIKREQQEKKLIHKF